MAWLQGLAGKAEHLLNRMDQTAADTLLHSPSTSAFGSATELGERVYATAKSHRHSNSSASTTSDTAHEADHRSLPEEIWKDVDSLENSIRRTASNQDFGYRSPSFNGDKTSRKKKNAQRSDAELLSYLNANDTEGHVLQNPGVSDSPGHGPLQTDASDEATLSLAGSVDRLKAGPADLQESGSLAREAVYRENQLLKTELLGLRRESSMALSRAKRAEQDLQKLLNQVSSERTKNAAENNAREADFINALKSKDVQTAVLRVQLEEAENNTKSLHSRLGDYESQLSRLRSEHNEYDSHNAQLESLRRRIAELDGMVNKERESVVYFQNQLTVSSKGLEEQNRELQERISLMEKNLVAEHRSREDVEKQMNMVLLECDLVRQELVDYQQKAHTILKAKDDLIASLKVSNGVVDDETFTMEAAEMEQEKEMLRTEIINLQSRLEAVTKQLHENEIQHRQDGSAFREQLIKLERALSEESSRVKQLEISLSSRTDELNFMENEFTRKEQSLQTRFKEREEELAKVRQQFFSRNELRPSEEELESRMRILTESLIQKQTAIETLNTERNSMAVQVDRLERRLREANTSGALESTITVVPGGTESYARSGHSFLSENLGDNEVARRFKRVYSTVDKFSFRLGTFLRRYPLARVMVIMYMFLLHFWVLVVLLTYTPEVHSFQPVKK